MKRIKNLINNKYALFAIFFFLFFMTFIKPFDSDTYWHLKAGEWILSNGFKIIDESMIHEGHYYTILVVEKGTDNYSEEDYIFGKFLNTDVFKEYWTFRKERLEKIIPNLTDENQIQEFNTLFNRIKERTE